MTWTRTWDGSNAQRVIFWRPSGHVITRYVTAARSVIRRITLPRHSAAWQRTGEQGTPPIAAMAEEWAYALVVLAADKGKEPRVYQEPGHFCGTSFAALVNRVRYHVAGSAGGVAAGIGPCPGPRQREGEDAEALAARKACLPPRVPRAAPRSLSSAPPLLPRRSSACWTRPRRRAPSCRRAPRSGR